MPIWDDPLDELIADLEQSVPAAPAVTFDYPRIEDYAFFTEAIQSRDPVKRARLSEDPRMKSLIDRLVRARQSSGSVE